MSLLKNAGDENFLFHILSDRQTLLADQIADPRHLRGAGGQRMWCHVTLVPNVPNMPVTRGGQFRPRGYFKAPQKNPSGCEPAPLLSPWLPHVVTRHLRVSVCLWVHLHHIIPQRVCKVLVMWKYLNLLYVTTTVLSKSNPSAASFV